MHFHAEVWVEGKDLNAEIEQAMGPSTEDGGFWSWYQIGGRWKGAHIPGYKAHEDPDHKVPCGLCGTTGKRSDEPVQKLYAEEEDKSRFVLLPSGLAEMQCNGCDGTGVSITYPTEWKPHPKDITPVGEVPEELTCYTLILPGKEALHIEEYTPPLEPEELGKIVSTGFNGKVKDALKERGITSGYMVTVDYHG